MDKMWLRFWKHVDVQPSGHWLWTGGRFSNGYGCFTVSHRNPRKQALAHRWLYEHMVGSIPDGLDLDHIMECRIGHCVNPQHLEPVTRAVNAQRREEARRLGLLPYAIKNGHPRGLHGRDKIECKRGHPLSGENVYLYQGHRCCKACKRLTKNKWRTDPANVERNRIDDARQHRERRTRDRGGKPAQPNHAKTHCPKGHGYTTENTYVDVEGRRRCRICLRIRNRERIAAWRKKKQT